jgi:hypothetical protein
MLDYTKKIIEKFDNYQLVGEYLFKIDIETGLEEHNIEHDIKNVYIIFSNKSGIMLCLINNEETTYGSVKDVIEINSSIFKNEYIESLDQEYLEDEIDFTIKNLNNEIQNNFNKMIIKTTKLYESMVMKEVKEKLLNSNLPTEDTKNIALRNIIDL